MSTQEILDIARQAKSAADRTGDNWADYVDSALEKAGIETNPQAARELCNQGEMNVVAVLVTGEIIECWDDGTWHIK
jgi:hypothetical protein